MTFNPVGIYPNFYGYGTNQLPMPVNQNDVSVFSTPKPQTDETVNKAKAALTVLSPIPSFRRVLSVPDSVNDENWGRAAGTLGLMALNLPADTRDAFKLGLAEISDIKAGKGPIKFQTKQNFFGATLLDELRHNKGWEWLNRALGYIDDYDKTAYEAGLGKYLRRTFNIADPEDKFFKAGTTKLKGYKFQGNIFQKTMGCALMRTSVIGVALSSLFEIPELYKAATVEGNISSKADSFTKQLCKSGAFVGLNTIAIAAAGGLAIAGGAGILAGLALSAVGGAIAIWGSNKLNPQIDKLFA